MTKYVFIGSSKFYDQIERLAREYRKRGDITFTPAKRVPHDGNSITNDGLEQKRVLYKKFHDDIDKADIAIVCNFQDYIGLNSAIDIGYALGAGKFIEILYHTKIPELLMLDAKVIE